MWYYEDARESNRREAFYFKVRHSLEKFNKHSMQRLKLLFVIGILLTLINNFISCQPEILPISYAFPTSTPLPPAPTKQITSNSLPLTEKWRWSGQTFELITITSDDKILVSVSQMWEGDKVIALDAYTGNIIWESEYIYNLRSIHADDKYVYVGSITFVRAYNLKTGQRVWEGAKQPALKRGGLYVYSTGKYLEVHDPNDGQRYLLDIDTGQTLLEGLKTNWDWTYRTWESVDRWPLVNNVMFINRSGRILAIHRAEPKQGWESTEGPFIGTIAFDGTLLYAIKEDATIVGLEPATGKIIGKIELIPNEAPPTVYGGYVTFYTIAASEKFVAAYYGNSQELIVFEK